MVNFRCIFALGYFRFVDINHLGDHHAVLYECDHAPWSMCEPDKSLMYVLSRSKISRDLESTADHLKEVVRITGFVSMDFSPVFPEGGK